MGKLNITVVKTTDGDVFGCFYSVDVLERDGFFNSRNRLIFFESYWLCMTPRQFFLCGLLKENAHVEFGNGKQHECVMFLVINAALFLRN